MGTPLSPPQISLSNPFRTDQAPKNFTFDAVYDETTQQKTFYEESCYDLVEGVMEGYNGTIFAYGQVSGAIQPDLCVDIVGKHTDVVYTR